MFSFFKRKGKNDDTLKNDGREASVSAADVTGGETEAGTEEVTTDLSLHPSQTVSQEQMYVLRFLNNELPPLKRNQLSLSGIEWSEQPNGIAVSAFVRNTVEREITLGEVPLLLLNEKNELKARDTFNLKDLGSLPADSSRPWTFLFPAASLDPRVELGKENWSVAFDLTSRKHKLDLDEKWDKTLPEEQKENLKRIVEKLGNPAKNELNFTGLSAATLDNGDLTISLLIRNGYERNVNIEKLPLQLFDAAGDLVAQGQFNVGDFEVKANTTKPWSFVFPASLVQKENADFSKWSVRVNK
ncbi:accessory Sec system S-layer assembly protein [Domibacillus indicus]|jgi:accessory Sec system S-layer assembly protein|uniref:accessory Sec system S-layer assembly protein n=1 Tax=Domibacillus indicus TaxID=1437523 RepID=UPI00203E65A0|nr:accessory Sec system S-layer assembly protein [Domibacillus indicus]MCM3791570.1 accessory Sec system S-layer assembly protein [Domibacillus indicus]